MQRYAVQTKGAVMRILHSSLENAAKGDDSPVGNAEVVVHTESNQGPVKRRKKESHNIKPKVKTGTSIGNFNA